MSITSKIHSISNFIEMLGLEMVPWSTVSGAHGYQDRSYWGCISIHYNGRPDMGIWLEMSGQGCRNFETFGNGDYERLFREVRQHPGEMNLTRLDVAFDEREGLLDLKTLERDTRDHEYVSRFKKTSIEWQRNEEDQSEGLSIYHGRKTSEILVRIYDKAVERGYIGDHWVRVELQLRKARAMAFLDAPGDVGLKFSGVLANYVRYVDDAGSDTNRWRWPMKHYWAELLEGVQSIRLYEKPGAEYNLSKLERFVYKQAGGAVATLLEIVGQDKFLEDLQARGTILNPKYRALLDDYYCGMIDVDTDC